MAGRTWSEEQKQEARERALARNKGEVVAEDVTMDERVQRARTRSSTAKPLRPIDQIRPYRAASVPDKSAGAYYLRPEGATIPDALIWYPNGAKLDREYDPTGKFSENAEYFQQRQRNKGFEYIGPTLTMDGVKRLVEVLEKNAPPEIERVKDEIALCQWTIENTDRPEVRDQERHRRDQLNNRLSRLEARFDAEALIAELEAIVNAQEMASVPPQVMRVMRRMLEAQGQKINDSLVQRFTRPVKDAENAEMLAEL